MSSNALSPAAAPFAALADDRRSGASAIAERAAAILESLAATSSFAALERAILELPSVQPEMAVLLHLADRALAALAAGGKQAVVHAAVRFRSGEESARRAIAERSLSFLGQARRVVTISASGTVLAALIAAARSRPDLAVVIGEGKPALEGRETGAALVAAGLAAAVVGDQALPDEVQAGDVVVVGADRVGWNGFANKIGTRALVAAAMAKSVASVVVTPSSRFLAERVDLEGGEDDQLVRKKPGDSLAAVTVAGVAGDAIIESVSFAGVTGVVTEEGILRPALAAERALAVRLDPRLVAMRLAAMREGCYER